MSTAAGNSPGRVRVVKVANNTLQDVFVTDISAVEIPTGAAVVQLQLTDFQADGLLDIVASLSNYSLINLTNSGSQLVLSSPVSLDSKGPIYIAKAQSEDILLRKLAGIQVLSASLSSADIPRFVKVTEGSDSLTVVAAGDFNGDGNIDLIAKTSGGVKKLIGDGNGAFPTIIEDTQLNTDTLDVADANGDGLDDVFIGDGTSGIRIAFSGLDGTSERVQMVDPTVKSVRRITSGDFNHDGLPDIVAVGSLNPTNGFTVLVYASARQGQSISYSSTSLDIVGFDLSSPVLADFDRDGFLDIVVKAQAVWKRFEQFHYTTSRVGKWYFFTQNRPSDCQ